VPNVSAAIVLLAGAVFARAGGAPAPPADTARQKFVGVGMLLAPVGLVARAIAFVAAIARQ
jgi:hypothetical protein